MVEYSDLGPCVSYEEQLFVQASRLMTRKTFYQVKNNGRAHHSFPTWVSEAGRAQASK